MSNIENLMGTTIDKIKKMVDANTVIGDPITSSEGTIIIPVSKISYGFASGGLDVPCKKVENKEAFGGGAGAGITVLPLAFIVIKEGDTKLLQLQDFSNSTDRIIGMAPDLLEKIKSIFIKDKSKKVNKESQKHENDATEDVKINIDDIEI